jgi:hypothetical protein
MPLAHTAPPAHQLTLSFADRTTAAAFRSEASRNHVVPTASGGAFHVSTNIWTSYSRRAAFSKGSSLLKGSLLCQCLYSLAVKSASLKHARCVVSWHQDNLLTCPGYRPVPPAHFSAHGEAPHPQHGMHCQGRKCTPVAQG